VALVLALGAEGLTPALTLALGGVEVGLLWVPVMLVASPEAELGVVELDDGVVLAVVVPAVWSVELVALACPVELIGALAELGALEALLEAL